MPGAAGVRCFNRSKTDGEEKEADGAVQEYKDFYDQI